MTRHVWAAALLVWSLARGCAWGQGVMLEPPDLLRLNAPPGCLPMEEPGEAFEIGPIEARGASLAEVLAIVAEREGLNIIAEGLPRH